MTAASKPMLELAGQIKQWGKELGFDQVGITDTRLEQEAPRLERWLALERHGDMDWMAKHRDLRLHPEQLVTGAIRAISVRMNYLPGDTQQIKVLKSPHKAYISRYALGRDYHKTVRKKLATLAQRIHDYATDHRINQRPFVDSAPVMERPLAAKAGLGWIGKHTLVLHPEAGSWFFLGEILTDLPLPADGETHHDQCGDCTACLKVCPTDAFPAPYELDARRCISYLTIEHKGSIPMEFREAMGNRVFGCDDCQAICPWNKFATPTDQADFQPRHQLDNSTLAELFAWDEATFLRNTQGSPIRRIGYQRWLRNLAIGLGNAPSDIRIIAALEARLADCSDLVREHIQWALEQQHQPHRRRRRKIVNPDRKNEATAIGPKIKAPKD